jgi:MFS family permease
MPRTEESRSARELITDRQFGPYFFGNLFSNAGNWFQNIAAGILVFEITGSNTKVGLISAIQFGAILVFTLWAGKLSDRVNRRRMLLFSQILAWLGAAGLAITILVIGDDNISNPLPVYLATAVIGTGYALSLPALQALVPALVRPGDLKQAIALNSVTFNLARAFGPAVAGWVVAAFGAGVAFGVNALSFLPLIIVLGLIRQREVDMSGETDGSISESFRIAFGDRRILVPLIGTLAIGFGSDPVNTLTPAIADLFGEGRGFVGLLVAAFGAGAALAAFRLGRFVKSMAAERAGAYGLAVLAAGMGALSLAPNRWAALAALAVAGVGFIGAITALNSAIQDRIAEEVRGRVMAIWSVFFLGVRPIAALVDGAIADAVSVRAGIAVPAMVAGGMALWLSSKARSESRTQRESVSAFRTGV